MEERMIEALARRGTAPLFPLPEAVLFPRVVLPLHVFEPRYRLMTEEALGSDRLIVMALLRPGWENDYDGAPAVHPVGCAGFIEDAVRLPDGRFNIRLLGIARVAIRETVRDRPYRVAAVEVLRDLHDGDGPDVAEDKRRLLAVCAGVLQEARGRAPGPFAIDPGVPFVAAVNALCQNLALGAETRLELLQEDDVRRRCRRLTALLEERWRSLALDRSQAGGAPETGVH